MPRPVPVATGTAVRASIVEATGGFAIDFPFRTLPAAAAFRRGDGVFIVFDGEPALDLSAIPRVQGRAWQDRAALTGPGYRGVRLTVGPDITITPQRTATGWRFTISPRSPAVVPVAPIARAEGAANAPVGISFGRMGVVHSVTDPAAGDTLLAALIPGEPMGSGARRAYVEATLLASSLGTAVEVKADGITAEFDQGTLKVGREGSLLGGEPMSASRSGVPGPVEAGLLPFDEWQLGTAVTRNEIRNKLERAAAAEGFGPEATSDARMTLAKFLLANELAPEALGALRAAALGQPTLEQEAEYRLMRGVANLMMLRLKDAEADLSATILDDDPSAELWRSYLAARKQDWIAARRAFEKGRSALGAYPTSWQAKFLAASSDAAYELNDLNTADADARLGVEIGAPVDAASEVLFSRARALAGRGDVDGALKILDQLAQGRVEVVAVKSTLEAAKLRRANGQITPAQAVEVFEALRFRWRGDGIELAAVNELGKAYTELGRFRDAILVLQSTGARLANDPAARAVRQQAQDTFVSIFLEDEAEKKLEPIQALALFYEFSDLTPFGPDGDRLVRRLAGRLVSFDLLDQAAKLLQHQVDNRLEGVGAAQVAGDLAGIYLMDRKAEQALTVLGSTRQPNLPTQTVAERRILEASALAGMGRYDHAIEVLERDQSPEAARVRAGVLWRTKDWEQAGPAFERLVAARGRRETLDEEDQQFLLRAAVAMKFSNDAPGLERLRRAWSAQMAATPEGAAFEIVTASIETDGMELRDVARRLAQTDVMDKFLARLKERMGARTAAGPAATAAAAPPAQAATPATAPTAAATPRS
jgi:hypothetical protein